jgi:hypothetical protein
MLSSLEKTFGATSGGSPKTNKGQRNKERTSDDDRTEIANESARMYLEITETIVLEGDELQPQRAENPSDGGQEWLY